jgi:RNA-directed DNA polymerase
LKLIRRRISDRKTTGLIRKFLNAGYSENGSIYKPEIGTPQGGVLSPLLANIYLHELDVWWLKHQGTQYIREKRRQAGRGNYLLSRYSDDFIMLSNDTKKGVEETKQRLTEFLREELELELSEEKTLVTHATEGFNFLGFHIRKYASRKGVIIKPSADSIQRIKDNIVGILDRRKHDISVVNAIYTLNPRVRGWANYYQYVNSYSTFHDLDFFLIKKFAKWYRGRHQLPLRSGTVKALEWMKGEQSENTALFTDIKVKRYQWRKPSDNPYIEMNVKKTMGNPFPDSNWYGNSSRNADLRMECIKRDKGVCQICQRPKINLEAHHIIPVEKGGEDTLSNLITVCKNCHRGKGWRERIQLVESRVR